MSHLAESENATQSLSFISLQWGVTEGFQIEKRGDPIWTARKKTRQQHGGHPGEEARKISREAAGGVQEGKTQREWEQEQKSRFPFKKE